MSEQQDLAFLERTLGVKRAEVQELQKRIRNEKRRLSRQKGSSSSVKAASVPPPPPPTSSVVVVEATTATTAPVPVVVSELHEDRLLARLSNACGASGVPAEELLRVLLPESVSVPSADRAGPLYHAYLRPVLRKYCARVSMRNRRVFWLKRACGDE